jgi:glycosyltransferase involved in cell wall biosynthesis
MSEKIAIYIPAYNAAATLPRVLERIPQDVKIRVDEIFVVDNDSKDNTWLVAEGCRHIQNIPNLEIIRNPTNMGYGGSQKIAYRRCLERGYKCVAMLHGDAQYAPEQLSSLIDPVVRGDTDLMFGSRMQGDPLAGGMPLHRFWGNRFLTTCQNRMLGLRLSEYHSGYRVYSVDALRRVAFESLSSDYHFDTEIIILFANRGLRIHESPIPTHYGDEKNYVNVWRYGMDVLITTASYYAHRRGWRRSRNWSRILSAGPDAR